ncbi:MAG TPA: TlpA disulfide reductase family protein [Bryobacteraceae bacterium]|jgi:thiol-disulfide isomerase/thioredoxin|nr:TlpA disulfide reductase family protein [Bryobacteraceae bacterium]
MKRFCAFLPLLCLIAVSPNAGAQQQITIVALVKVTAAAGDFATARKALDQYRAKAGTTPEYIEALSWIGRGELAHHDLAAAEQNSDEVRKLSLAQVAHRKLDAEPHLPIAFGAAIEVEGQALAASNQRDQAILFLNDELKKWQATSIHDRIQKNINLLTLEGKPAPVLDISQGIGSRKPLPLSAHLGHPVLLFLWAHWCSDCKNEIPIVQKLMANYGPRGLVVVAPTQHYGYIAGGRDAPPDVETKYIGQVFARYYAGLGSVEIPLSETNFARFGVSTTPTLVLVDGKGIVRLYNPGNAAYEVLAAKIEAALRTSKS